MSFGLFYTIGKGFLFDYNRKYTLFYVKYLQLVR